MWINYQIGRKNMTGKLQKCTNSNFFLSIVGAAFDSGHGLFFANIKWFIVILQQTNKKCEYRKISRLQQAFLFSIASVKRHI